MTRARATKPLGAFFIAIFFAAATFALVGVSAALAFPGSRFEAIWRLYLARRPLVMPYRSWLVPGFLALGIPKASASVGCFATAGGAGAAVAIFVVNGLGDATQVVMGCFLEGGVGVAPVGVILQYRLLARRAARLSVDHFALSS